MKKELTQDWNIELEIPKRATGLNGIKYDWIFDCQYLSIKLTNKNENIGKRDTKSEFVLLDKYLTSKEFNNRQIYDYNDNSLRRKHQVLQRLMMLTENC